MVSLGFSEFNEWTDAGHGILHPLSAVEHQVSLCNEVTI
jgi:hypothetical protein